MLKRQKNLLKYTNCAELKKITIRLYWNCLIYSSFFSNLLTFISFCLMQKQLLLKAI